MNGKINTQIASEVAAANSPQPLGKVSKTQTPVQKDNIQPTTEKVNARQQLPEDPAKVKEIVKDSINYIDKFLQELQVDLKYEVDEKTDDIIIKIFEKGTDNLIRQVPPEAILKLKQRISDLLGIIYDEVY
jgi:flagellar protein FlaG